MYLYRLHPEFNSQRGVALITVLFAFVLAILIVGGLVSQLNTNIQRGSAFIESEQASLLCLSGEELSRQILDEDFKKNPQIDHMNEGWAKYAKSNEVDNGYIEISIIDAQGLFNINNMVTPGGTADQAIKADFSRLINYSLEQQKLSDDISNELSDWLDTDKTTGVEQADYSTEDPPYKPPNTLVTNISEIRLLKSVDAETYSNIYHDIFPALTALPAHTLININTINPVVLAGLTGLDIPAARNIVKMIRSNNNGFASVQDALQLLPQNLHAALAPRLTVSSSYFQIRVRAKFGDHYAFLQSLVFRDPQNGGKMTIISRDFGQRFIFPYSKDYNENTDLDEYDIDI